MNFNAESTVNKTRRRKKSLAARWYPPERRRLNRIWGQSFELQDFRNLAAQYASQIGSHPVPRRAGAGDRYHGERVAFGQPNSVTHPIMTINDLTVNISHLDRETLLSEWQWLIGTTKFPILATLAGDDFVQDSAERLCTFP